VGLLTRGTDGGALQAIDLDALSGELLAVVEQTMQPTRVSLWLRPQPPSGAAGTTVARVETSVEVLP
jgi:hypothetical protein